jgi:hypothetical protein
LKRHLIHIGYPKSGSTFLQEWFLQNPQLHYAPGGLGGFHNVYQISQNAAAQDGKDFQYFVTSDESLCIPQISTGTVPINDLSKSNFAFSNTHAQNKNCETLKALYPNAIILFVTRGFESLIKSGYSQLVRTGFQYNIEQYKQAFNFEDKQISANIDYSSIIDSYERAFGQENLIVLPYEMLRDNQNAFLNVLEEKLGLVHFECHLGRINESLSAEELYWYPKISASVARFSQSLGKNAHKKIFRWYVNKTIKNDFKNLIRLLNKIQKGNQHIESSDFSEALNFIRKNNKDRFAAKLKNEALYTPYLKEYLLDNM